MEIVEGVTKTDRDARHEPMPWPGGGDVGSPVMWTDECLLAKRIYVRSVMRPVRSMDVKWMVETQQGYRHTGYSAIFFFKSFIFIVCGLLF